MGRLDLLADLTTVVEFMDWYEERLAVPFLEREFASTQGVKLAALAPPRPTVASAVDCPRCAAQRAKTKVRVAAWRTKQKTKGRT